MESIDELYQHWQTNPDPTLTVALCDALRTSNRADLVEIVGSHASRQDDVPALMAAGRMYTDTGRLDDAQSVLLAAGKLAPRDGEIYRWLGEVLLRRGDAERAEKVLERAVQFGAEMRAGPLLARARSLLPTQRSSGMIAAAEAFARSIASERAHPAVPPVPTPPPRPPALSIADDAETQIKKNREVQDALVVATSMGLQPPLPPPRPPPTPPPMQTAAISEPRPISASFAARPFGPATAPFGSPPSSRELPAEPPAAAPPWMEQPRQVAPPPSKPIGTAPPSWQASAEPAGMPEARDVLDALQVSGVFEPETLGPANVAWAPPERGRRRIGSFIALVTLALVLVGGGTSAFLYIKEQRAKHHLEAEALLVKVEASLLASDPNQLEATEKAIGRAFDLESRSRRAAMAWLEERVMVGLLKQGDDVAFADAIARAKEVGIEDRRLAFAHVASFLFQGDVAGAATAIAKWDSQAEGDAYFQLVAGATFERAGDPRALDRYAAATRLAPDLFIAKVLLARATAIDGDPQKALELAGELRAQAPGRPESEALVALAWARSRGAGAEVPEDARNVVARNAPLPVALRAVPAATRAVVALEKRSWDEVGPAVEQGLGVADTPGMATWLGSIALAAGDEARARRAALSAVSYSSGYVPARILAARVALLGARLDEASKAVEEIPRTSPDAAVVGAAVGYEKLDADRMTRALEGLAAPAKKLPFLVPLTRGKELMAGDLGLGIVRGAAAPTEKVLEMATEETPWSDLVAMDWALDTGDLDTAKKIAQSWKGEPRPLRAIRLARLARYDGRGADADKFSLVAIDGHAVTMRALTERVFSLVMIGKADLAVALTKAHPELGGASAKWLRAYALAQAGKLEEARALVADETPPPPLATANSRVLAVVAYAAMKDVRHGADPAKALVALGYSNPDVLAAADKLGLPKPARRRP